MALPSFVLNDERKKNSHGFYLVNAGGRFERFNDNPVMLDHHVIEELIGKWKNLRVDGHQLIADPDFDEGTPLGAERKGQVDRGYLKGASPGIMPLAAEYRDNQVTGECDLYVTDWELMEGSVASIPSNAGALSLVIYGLDNQPIADGDVKLHMDKIVKLSADGKAQGKTSNIKIMEKITLTAAAILALGINDNADAAAISEAIVKQHNEKKDLAAEVDKHKNAETARITKEATDKVDLAIADGRATADNRAELIQLAIDKPALFDKLVGNQPGKVSLAAAVKPITGASVIPAERANWTLLKWMKEDQAGLDKIKGEDPQAYEQIKKVRN